MNVLPMLSGWSVEDFAIAGRIALASVMSHGGETPVLFAFYTDLLRTATARPFRWR